MIMIIRRLTQIGEILRDLRKARGIGQLVLGSTVGIDDGQISKYERSLVVPTVDTLRRLLFGLGYELVVMPKVYAATTEQRDAVVAAAAAWYAHGPDDELAAPGGADRALVAAVQRLVAAELGYVGRDERRPS